MSIACLFIYARSAPLRLYDNSYVFLPMRAEAARESFSGFCVIGRLLGLPADGSSEELEYMSESTAAKTPGSPFTEARLARFGVGGYHDVMGERLIDQASNV